MFFLEFSWVEMKTAKILHIYVYVCVCVFAYLYVYVFMYFITLWTYDLAHWL